LAKNKYYFVNLHIDLVFYCIDNQLIRRIRKTMIPKETIDRIYDAVDILDVVGDFVNLKKRGANYIGLCPFHNEKTPSFSVSQSKGIYKCFGCQKGGNAVNFIMEQEHLGYHEALKYLAKKYNIEVVEKEMTAEDVKKKNEDESLMIVTSYAMKYFEDTLHNHPEGKAVGMAYLRERGFHDPVIEKFQLGYCPEGKGVFTEHASKNGYKMEFLVKTGLTIEKGNMHFDRFSARVIFPIHSLSGKPIGFGGRIMKNEEKTAKYLNSPESPIYHKSRVLYGMYQAKKAITSEDQCYLVEGYTDVMAMHQAGIENVVASSGTALTTEQIRLIKRFTSNITVIFDGDAAGIKASLRGIDMILEEGMNVKVLTLPEGEDPDSYAKKLSLNGLKTFIAENETDFIRFKSGLLMKDAKDDPVKRANMITEIVRSVAVIPEGITRSVYIKECSRILDVEERLLNIETNKVRRRIFEKNQKSQHRATETTTPEETAPRQGDDMVREECSAHEKEIVRLLLNYGNINMENEDEDESDVRDKQSVCAYIIESIVQDDIKMRNPVYQKIFDLMKQNIDNGAPFNEKEFVLNEDKQISSLSADILSRKPYYEISKIWKRNEKYIETEDMKLRDVVEDAVLAYKNQRVYMKLNDVRDKLKKAQDENRLDEIPALQRKFIELNELKINLSKNLGERIIL
jgi:DNA primase